jgi:hypothetical protein
MARTVRLSAALVLALIMVMALAGTALAFNPPNNPNGVGANSLCEPPAFPGNDDAPGLQAPAAAGPWHATEKAGLNPAIAVGIGLDGEPPIDGGATAENPCG